MPDALSLGALGDDDEPPLHGVAQKHLGGGLVVVLRYLLYFTKPEQVGQLLAATTTAYKVDE